MDVSMKPIEALTGLLNLPSIGNIRLDFLITEVDSDAFYIHCLDFGIMSRGKTIEECKEDIQEAILIYLEDLPEGQGLFKPSPPQYWQMFYDFSSPEIPPYYLKGIIDEFNLPEDTFDG